MEVFPNPVMVAAQLVPFLVTLVALHFIIFKPMLAYLQEREHASDDGRREAAELERKITAQVAEYEQKLAAAHAEVVELRSTRRSEAAKAYEARIAQARAEAERTVSAALEEIEGERKVGRASLEQTSRSLAEQIAGRVLGRELAAG